MMIMNLNSIKMQKEAFNTVKAQAGPCGITCGTCPLGNGSVAESAAKTMEYINTTGVKDWSRMVPGGATLDWDKTLESMTWLTKYAYCQGCEKGGGPPDCAIRVCANEKGYTLCNQCKELSECTKFDWLGNPKLLKQTLAKNKRKTKEDYVKVAIEAMK